MTQTPLANSFTLDFPKDSANPVQGLPAQVTGIIPTNGATDQGITTDISWDAAALADTYDVYFGTTSGAPTFIGTQAGLTYDTGTLSNSTTYFIRIDSQNGLGITYGVESSFSTIASEGGDTFSISGTGFGAHSLDVEFLGDPTGHLKTAPLGEDHNFGSWHLDSDFNVIKNIVDDANRGQSWLMDYTGVAATPNGDIRFDYGSNIPENTEVYVGFWAYLETNETVGQWKILRVKADSGLSDSGGEVAMFNWFGGTGKQLILRPDDALGANDISGYNAQYPLTDKVFTFVELILKSSTEGVANGSILQGRRREGSTYELANLTSNSQPAFPENGTMTYGESLRWRHFMFQNFIGNGFGTSDNPMNIAISDPYIQVGTTKRVFLTDNADFSLVTWSELQRPLSWSDTLITVRTNLANRPAGTYWVHVVEGIDTVLKTQQVTI